MGPKGFCCLRVGRDDGLLASVEMGTQGAGSCWMHALRLGERLGILQGLGRRAGMCV